MWLELNCTAIHPTTISHQIFFRRKLKPRLLGLLTVGRLVCPKKGLRGTSWTLIAPPPRLGGGRERGVSGPQRGSAWDIGGQQLGGRMLANYIDRGRGGGEGRRVQGGKLTTPLTTCNSHP